MPYKVEESLTEFFKLFVDASFCAFELLSERPQGLFVMPSELLPYYVYEFGLRMHLRCCHACVCLYGRFGGDQLALANR